MTLPTNAHLAVLSHTEVVALVKERIAAMQRLEAENQQLKAELAKALPPPPPNVAQLLTAAVTRCEAEPCRDAQAQETRAPVWACAADAAVGGSAGPDY